LKYYRDRIYPQQLVQKKVKRDNEKFKLIKMFIEKVKTYDDVQLERKRNLLIKLFHFTLNSHEIIRQL
jgi:hypothetical protein